MANIRTSEIRRMQRDISQNANALTRIRSEEDYPQRESQLHDTLPINALSGTAVNRPPADYLIQRGVKSMLYFATDTFVLSAWTGTAWKTTTLV